MKAFILLSMVFMHVLAEFCLQGYMAKMKQKTFWKDFKQRYKHDWIAALSFHSFSWTYLTTLPIALFVYGFDIDIKFLVVVSINFLIHDIVDDLKANKLRINLITDQCIHIIQIILTFLVLV